MQAGWTTGSGGNQGTQGMAEALLWEDPIEDTCLPAGDSPLLLPPQSVGTHRAGGLCLP